MWLFNSLFNGGMRRWIQRHSLIFTANLVSSLGAVQLWCNGQEQIGSALTLCCFGASYLYCSIYSRDKLSSNDAIVITGCDSGLGFSLAMHCRKLGAHVIASVLQCDGLGAQKLRHAGITVCHLNLLDKKSIQTFADAVKDTLFTRNLNLRALVNNAGVMIFGEFEWQTDEQISTQVEVNIMGTYRITKALLPLIRAHKSRIIPISSHCTIESLPGVATYGSTKSAVNCWANGIRVELKKHGIKVVSFIPGSFANESNIMARQTQHFEVMKAAMPEEVKNFYGDYFTRYAQYFEPLSVEREPKVLSNTRLHEIFEDALLDRRPAAIYTCEPWSYFFYYRFFKIAPTALRDSLILRFVRFPEWMPVGNDKKSE